MWSPTARTRTSALLIAASAMLALVVTGCGSSDTSAASGGSDDTITVQVPPITDAATLYLAQQEGLFKKAGLDVKITVGQGGAAIAAALQSGSTDVGMVNYVSAVSGLSNGLPIELVSEATQGSAKSFGPVVPGNSKITSVADLKGAKIGVISTGSVSDLTTDVQLDAAGVSPSDVSYVNVPLPNLLSALGKQVDASSLNEPTLSAGIAQGDRLVLDAYTGQLAGLPVAGYFTTSRWAKAHPDLAKKFAEAIATAARTAGQDESKVRDLLPSYTTLNKAQTADIALPIYAASTDVSKVQTVADLMLKYHFLTSPVDMAVHVAG